MKQVKKEELIRKILFTLNKNKIRATYKAVASFIGGHAIGVSKYLGDPRPEASWVVTTSSPHLPSKYSKDEYHPNLEGSRVIFSGDELKGLIEKECPNLT